MLSFSLTIHSFENLYHLLTLCIKYPRFKMMDMLKKNAIYKSIFKYIYI